MISNYDYHILCNDFEQDAVTRKTKKYVFFFQNAKFRWALKTNQRWDTFWRQCVFRSILATFTGSYMSEEGQVKMPRKWARYRFHSYAQHPFQEPAESPSPGRLCLRCQPLTRQSSLLISGLAHRTPPGFQKRGIANVLILAAMWRTQLT